jgi:methylated-DNA-[protein]-cysteine S-methyltransferase
MTGARAIAVELACVGAVSVELSGDTPVRLALLGGPRPPAFRVVGAQPSSAIARDLLERLRAYDRGDDPCFHELALPEEATAFAARVRDALRATALGETLTYRALATRAGSPRGARAVGGALARNRWPIVVPCHRVLAATGAGGFTGGEGLATKRALLAHEAVSWPRAP